jgi:hypothetical protein
VILSPFLQATTRLNLVPLRVQTRTHAHNQVTPSLPYLIPAVESRMGQPEIEEDSEEVSPTHALDRPFTLHARALLSTPPAHAPDLPFTPRHLSTPPARALVSTIPARALLSTPPTHVLDRPFTPRARARLSTPPHVSMSLQNPHVPFSLHHPHVPLSSRRLVRAHHESLTKSLRDSVALSTTTGSLAARKPCDKLTD